MVCLNSRPSRMYFNTAFYQLISPSIWVGHSVGWTNSQPWSVTQSVCQSVSLNQLVSQSVSQSMSRSIDRSVSQSLILSIKVITRLFIHVNKQVELHIIAISYIYEVRQSRKWYIQRLNSQSIIGTWTNFMPCPTIYLSLLVSFPGIITTVLHYTWQL